mgnify:CR=1 FL=1
MRILAVAGASGGHIFPATAFLDDFKHAYPDARTLLVLPAKSIQNKIPATGHQLRFIGVSALSLQLSWRNIVALLRFLKSLYECVVIMAQFRPDIVTGFGSIASIPLVLCAWLFRTTVIIHEQNVIPGRANRFLAYLSDGIAVSFKESPGFFAGNGKKAFWTGNIVRRSLVRIDKREALCHFGLEPDKTTILVMGGSQASRRINFGFAKAFKEMSWQRKCQVIHLCGEADKDGLAREYAACEKSVRLLPFLSQMQYAYSCADLVVSRAGATTIAELIAYRIPAVLVPYPYAYNHQDANARILSDAGCAALVPDSGVDTGELLQALESVGRNGAELEAMSGSYARLTSEKPASLVEQAIRIHGNGQ